MKTLDFTLLASQCANALRRGEAFRVLVPDGLEQDFNLLKRLGTVERLSQAYRPPAREDGGVFDKLARELEAVNSGAALVDLASDALCILSNKSIGPATARAQALVALYKALSGQNWIETRCQDMALAVRGLALLPASTDEYSRTELWRKMVPVRSHSRKG